MPSVKTLHTLKYHYSFFRFLKTHPQLKQMDFEEWVQVCNYEWEFCSKSHGIIVELLDPESKGSYLPRQVDYHLLRYEISMWNEFPEIVAEDIVSFCR